MLTIEKLNSIIVDNDGDTVLISDKMCDSNLDSLSFALLSMELESMYPNVSLEDLEYSCTVKELLGRFNE